MSISEKEALIRVIRAHKGILAKIIRTYCRNSDDWKDLEQEIIIQLWKSLDKYDDSFKQSTWVYRIALNVVISHYRSNKNRMNSITLDDNILQFPEESFNEEEQERRQRMYNTISKLNDFDKALIILYLEDNSQKEIAEIMGITESNVSTKLNRIRNKLRTTIEN